ncbi:MAG: Histone H1 [Parcubacteria group bacterium GW2011_GWA2_46_10]|nr:MAG: Histone H1 [Parcubacteria group bacterium GW2011_GWA2_46_10]
MPKATRKKKVKKSLKRKSPKKTKKVVSKKRVKKTRPVKKSFKRVKKVVKKRATKKLSRKKLSSKARKTAVKSVPRRGSLKNEEQLAALITRGQEKGFVTDLEILEYFPNIEDDTDFLDKIYEELEQNSLKVIEVETLLGEGTGEVTEKELKER